MTDPSIGTLHPGDEVQLGVPEPLKCLLYVTAKLAAEVALPPGVWTVIGPEVAPVGTVTVILV
jgi:hypothetical protein